MTAVFPESAQIEPIIFSQASPASTWVIEHGLGRPPFGLALYDSGDTQVFGSVENPDSDTTVVTFISAFGGKAEYR